jgi:predicted acyltransferase
VAIAGAGAQDFKQGRLVSVDALRGFDMFWIAGGVEVVKSFMELFQKPLTPVLEYQFHHVEWVGFAAWDLIMPLFLFIVGVSMPFSFSKRREAGDAKWPIYRHVLRRVVILWILGTIAQGNLLHFNLDKLHLYSNTLRSIAAGYLLGSVALLELNVIGRAILTVVLLLAYWLIVMVVPFDGYAAGTLDPHHNLPLFIDEKILGHFRDGTTYTWIFSSLTFAATTLMGILGGELLRSKLAPWRKVGYLLGAGVGLVALGLVWGMVFPIIKHIWTSSMCVYAAGWSFLLLGLFYMLIDVLGYKKWAFFFVVIGMNAIAVYMAFELFSKQFEGVGKVLVGHLGERFPQYSDFLVSAAAMTVIWLLLYFMYKKKTFIKV